MQDRPPALFDLHLYPEGVSDQDLESMRFFGVEAALATTHYALPAITPRKLLAQFDRLISEQLPRMERAGIRAYAAVGKLGSEGLVFNSEMGSGAGDLTALARAVSLLKKAGLSERLSARVRWKNARAFLKLPDD